MKRYLFLLFLLPGTLCAQSTLTEKLQPHAGLMLAEYVGLRYPNGQNLFSNSPGSYYQALAGGVNYVYLHSNDFLSLGFEPNLHFGLRFTDPVGLLVQTPLFVTGKIGAGATNFSEGTVSFTLGVGANFTYFRIPSLDPSTNISYVVEGQFVAPAIMAELSIHTTPTPWAVRFHMNLNRVRTDVDVSGITQARLDLSNMGIGLVYYFNLNN